MNAPLRPPIPSAPIDERWHEYERRKNQWTLEHPDAKPDEYHRAMQQIARDCGV